METSLNVLLGSILSEVFINEVEHQKLGLVFKTVDNVFYKLEHVSECYESVTIEDINGDLSDLVGSPILVSEVVTKDATKEYMNSKEEIFSATWSFYKFATIKGHVVVRFIGVSNGCYSELVNFYKIC